MNFLKHLSLRERIILYLCLAVILLAIGYNLIAGKIMSSWANLNLEVARAEKELIRSQRLIRKEKDIISEYERYIAYTKVKGGPADKSSDILIEIETIARNNNVAAMDIKPLRVKAIDFYQKYTFEVSAEADIKALAKFMYDLQASSYLLVVEYAALTTKDSSGAVLHAEMRIAHASVP